MPRTETISISERSLMFVVAGQLYGQAPNRQPRKADDIMMKVRDSFRKVAYNDHEHYSYAVDADKLVVFIRNLLFAIPEFTELNLSEVEFFRGISVDDPSRPKYSFTSRYDIESPSSWMRDFIDLDAFIGNVVSELFRIKDSYNECFICKHNGSGKSIACTTCTMNPDLECNYAPDRTPKGKYTVACTFDCFKCKYICCEECGERNACPNRCTSTSDSCGLVLHKEESIGKKDNKDEQQINKK